MKVVQGLRTGSFVTVTNLAPQSCGYREILPGKFFLINNLHGLTSRVKAK